MPPVGAVGTAPNTAIDPPSPPPIHRRLALIPEARNATVNHGRGPRAEPPNSLPDRLDTETHPMAYATNVTRHQTREVGVGGVLVGGSNPIWVQSMTTTNTFDVAEATLAQIKRLEEAECEIVRVTVPKKEDVEGVRGDPGSHEDSVDRRHPLRLSDGPRLPGREDPLGSPRRGQDPDQPRQHRRRRAVQGGRPQGPRQGDSRCGSASIRAAWKRT